MKTNPSRTRLCMERLEERVALTAHCVELPDAAIPGITNAFLSMGENAQAVFHSAVFSCFELPDTTASLMAETDESSLPSHSAEALRHAAETGYLGHFLTDLAASDEFVLTPATVSLQPDAESRSAAPGFTADQVTPATLLLDFLQDLEASTGDPSNNLLLNLPSPDSPL